MEAPKKFPLAHDERSTVQKPWAYLAIVLKTNPMPAVTMEVTTEWLQNKANNQSRFAWNLGIPGMKSSFAIGERNRRGSADKHRHRTMPVHIAAYAASFATLLISARSISLRWTFAAATASSICCGLRTPTIAPVTPGCRKVQAIATAPGGTF